VDARGAGVELRVVGIETAGPDGKPGPVPTGPAQLRVAYLANVLQPDIRQRA
jgi:hypothetical protein